MKQENRERLQYALGVLDALSVTYNETYQIRTSAHAAAMEIKRVLDDEKDTESEEEECNE